MEFDQVKYFKPDLSDFHVGYEFEAVIHRHIPDPNKPFETIKLVFDATGFNAFNKDHSGVITVPNSVIVPYLTADQIIKEGYFELVDAPFEVYNKSGIKLNWFAREEFILSF